MDFAASQTKENLARAFAAESHTRNLYSYFANQAQQEGLAAVAKKITEIADNEYAHAWVFFQLIKIYSPQGCANIQVAAGFPMQQGATLDNMLFAAKAEATEHAELYPAFAATAEKEGFTEAAAKFRLIAQVEGQHQNIFNQLHQMMLANKLYQSQTPVQWVCSYCGHNASGLQPWQVCPRCGKPQGFVKLQLS